MIISYTGMEVHYKYKHIYFIIQLILHVCDNILEINIFT